MVLRKGHSEAAENPLPPAQKGRPNPTKANQLRLRHLKGLSFRGPVHSLPAPAALCLLGLQEEARKQQVGQGFAVRSRT